MDRDFLTSLADSRGRRPLPPLASACLIVVDLQRFFTEPGAPRFLPDWPERLPGVRALIEAFQRRGLPVIATRHGHPPGDPGGTMGLFFDRLLGAEDPFGRMDPTAGLPADVRVFRKQRYSVFSVPEIEQTARQAGAVVLVGVQTHRCILASALDGARLEVRPVVVADACAAGRPEDHQAAIRVLAQGHAHVATVAEVLDALDQGAVTREAPEEVPRKAPGGLVTWDLLVVGGGPAGVSCAIQARREGWSVLVMGDQPPGGLLPAARRIDNLPGHPRGIPGPELARRLAAHLARSGAIFRRGRVTALDRNGPGRWIATGADGSRVAARAVCLATGTRPVPPPWPVQEDAPVARDVRDWPDRMEGEAVVIIGGGEAALDGALNARDRGAYPRVLARHAVKGSTALLRAIRRHGIEVRTGVDVEGLDRAPSGQWMVRTRGGAREIADRVLVCIGREPETDLVPERWRFPGGPTTIETPFPGLWMAGDVIRAGDRFVATALGDGQRAAVLAGNWLRASGASHSPEPVDAAHRPDPAGPAGHHPRRGGNRRSRVE